MYFIKLSVNFVIEFFGSLGKVQSRRQQATHLLLKSYDTTFNVYTVPIYLHEKGYAVLRTFSKFLTSLQDTAISLSVGSEPGMAVFQEHARGRAARRIADFFWL